MTLISGIFLNSPIDVVQIPQGLLNIDNKSRSNPLPWNGQFSPQLVQTLVDHYAFDKSNLLDPFVGSGTVLLEAGYKGLAATGVEINPAAVILARIYELINLTIPKRQECIRCVSRLLNTSFPIRLLVTSVDEESPDAEAVKSMLLGMVMSVKDPDQSRLVQALIVLVDFYKPGLSAERVLFTWSKLQKLVLNLPYSEQPIRVIHTDARSIAMPDHSVDLVITSPPYINVFNYHQQYRSSTESLNWDLLSIAKSEIGSNRKHRGNRFLTVIQYCLDIAQVINELSRLTKPDGRLIFIVGRESRVRGTPFYNGAIVAEIAHAALGCDLILRQERVFTNRFGQSIYEDILHLTRSTPQIELAFLDYARAIAVEFLETSYDGAVEAVKYDIDSAIKLAPTIAPSQLLDIKCNCNSARNEDQ